MSVVAKFFVSTITERAHQKGQKEITLNAVSRGEENKTWAKYTPTGSIVLGILNEEASAQFVLGEEYLITFEHSPKPE